MSSVYLVKASLLRSELTDYELFNSHILDPDMAYCQNVRNKVSKSSLRQWLNHLISCAALVVDIYLLCTVIMNKITRALKGKLQLVSFALSVIFVITNLIGLRSSKNECSTL